MTVVGHQTTVEKQVIEIDEIVVDFFDMLARLNFEDEKSLRLSQEGHEAGSPMTDGEPALSLSR